VKVIVPLAGYGTRMRPHTWSRAKPLLNVAGNTIIGHLLNLMSAITTEEVIFVVGYKGDEIESWIRRQHPHLNTHFVVQEEALGQAHAIWLCRDFLDDEGQVLIAFGDGIIDADYETLPDTDADALLLVQEMEDPLSFGVVVLDEDENVTDIIEKPSTSDHKLAVAGICWFRHGHVLRQALDQTMSKGRKIKGEFYLADTYQRLLQQGVKIRTKPVRFWFDAGQPDFMLFANARLLSLGYGSEDAVERSYAQDFTVLPPVFIHESANVTASVIGPYVNVEANVRIHNSVIRNSLIDANSQIEDCVLDGALIGEHCLVTGRRQALFIGDHSRVNFSEGAENS
jgi:glucose-1-phosphate thymidylyltransferase